MFEPMATTPIGMPMAGPTPAASPRAGARNGSTMYVSRHRVADTRIEVEKARWAASSGAGGPSGMRSRRRTATSAAGRGAVATFCTPRGYAPGPPRSQAPLRAPKYPRNPETGDRAGGRLPGRAAPRPGQGPAVPAPPPPLEAEDVEAAHRRPAAQGRHGAVHPRVAGLPLTYP